MNFIILFYHIEFIPFHHSYIMEFSRVIEKSRILTDLPELIPFSYDATRHRCIPSAVLRPVTKKEVVEILKIASKKRIPVVPRGAGTSLTGASVPVKGGIVIDLTLLSSIKWMDFESRCLAVEPGVVYDELNKELAKEGFYFPSEPGSGKVCTIGGMVATNATGIRGVKYGPIRDYVLSLEVILPNGEVLRVGSPSRTSSSGYALKDVFIGSEGTLGIFTEILLRVVPRPEFYATALVSFSSMEDACRDLASLMKEGIRLSVAEVLDSLTLETISMYTKLRFPKVKALLLLETDGWEEREVDKELRKALKICSNAIKVERSKYREKLWEARKAAFPSLAKYTPSLLTEDVAVPVSKLAELVKKIEEISASYKIRVATFGHAGEGILHPTFLLDEKNLKIARSAAAKLIDEAIKLGGTITGEHGIGIEKRDFMGMEHGRSLRYMKMLKNIFDPSGIMNPGKVC
jgi:glycolate oxidase